MNYLFIYVIGQIFMYRSFLLISEAAQDTRHWYVAKLHQGSPSFTTQASHINHVNACI
jgi:hypothetical protein